MNVVFRLCLLDEIFNVKFQPGLHLPSLLHIQFLNHLVGDLV